MISPAFYFSQVDIFGPYSAQSEHGLRSKVKVWALAFKCPATLAVHVNVMETYSASSFVQAFTRFGSIRGYPAKLFIDQGSNLIKGIKDMDISVIDLCKQVNTKFRTSIEFQTCPAGMHQANGMIERQIKGIKEMFAATFEGLRFSILGLETCFMWICNQINSLPLCLGSDTEDLDNLDILCSNRLLLGRNNVRSMAGRPRFGTLTRLEKQMRDVEEAWQRQWSVQRILKFLPEHGVGTNLEPPEVFPGDIVIFTRKGGRDDEEWGAMPWRLGRVIEVQDGKHHQRSVWLEYSNGTQAGLRRTYRSLRSVVVLQKEADSDPIAMMNYAAWTADLHLLGRLQQ